jgi:hypothetical protein
LCIGHGACILPSPLSFLLLVFFCLLTDRQVFSINAVESGPNNFAAF